MDKDIQPPTTCQPIAAADNSPPLPEPVKNLIELFQVLNYDNVESIKTVYREDIEFIDPLHRIKGIKQLRQYFRNQYQNTQAIQFEYHKMWSTTQSDHCESFIRWSMELTHSRLNKGRPYKIDGMSYLKSDDQHVFYHQDYFDLGELIYQRLPIIGGLIRWIKRKL